MSVVTLMDDVMAASQLLPEAEVNVTTYHWWTASVKRCSRFSPSARCTRSAWRV
ncbi:MAG TPA: hypothetical protein VLJ61_00920 [Pyrinomonadaceae bacterium]|nr:hypothetical protein [Pyrinomonadaceae bacterium]